MSHQSIVLALSFPLSIIMTVVWISRHRKKAKAERMKSNEGARSGGYTSAQMWGIVGIVFFLLPLLFGICLNLARGAMILGAFLLRLVPLPQCVELVLWIVIVSSAFFMALAGTYYLVDMVWPKKNGAETASSA